MPRIFYGILQNMQLYIYIYIKTHLPPLLYFSLISTPSLRFPFSFVCLFVFFFVFCFFVFFFLISTPPSFFFSFSFIVLSLQALIDSFLFLSILIFFFPLCFICGGVINVCGFWICRWCCSLFILFKFVDSVWCHWLYSCR